MKKVAVIGAGPAGCYAAYRLQQRGHRVVIFEAQEQVGGRTQSYRHDGYTIDSGAAFITNFYPITHKLIQTLNLSNEVKPIDRSTALYHAGQIAQLKLGSAKSFLQYPFLSAGDKAKIAVHIAKLTACRFQLSLTDLKKLAKNDDASIAEYTRRQLNEQIYQNVVRPGIEPFWYFGCESVSRALYMALSAHAADAKFYVFKDGIDRLCQSLVRHCDVRTGQMVKDIHEVDAGLRISVSASNAILTSNSGSRPKMGNDTEGAGNSDIFDAVVLATTASHAHKMTNNLNTDFISEQQRQYLTTQEYVANTHCVFKTKAFKRDFKAFSLFPCGPGTHPIAAISFNSEKCARLREGGQELISLYLGSDYSRRLAKQIHETNDDGPTTQVFTQVAFNEATDAACATGQDGLASLMATAYEQSQYMCRDLPSLSEVSPFYCVQRKEAIPVPTVGRYQAALAFQEQQKARGALADNIQKRRSPSICFVGDYLSTATVEGALASAEAVV